MINSPYDAPPAWIRKFLSIFLEPRLLEASLGDLEEKFHIRLKQKVPAWRASLAYILEAVGFLRMGRFQHDKSIQNAINMISHTFVFFSRLVKKDKSFYLVSLLGLSLSLASFLLIMMFVKDELAYDKFHNNSERLFRLTTHLKLNNEEYHEATSQFPAGEALESDLVEVEAVTRVFPQTMNFELGDSKFGEHVILVDRSFFEIFTFPLIEGDRKTILDDPNSVILTQETARKYFDMESPVGKSILVNGLHLVVAGVAQNVPSQSHLKFDAIIPLTLQLNIWKGRTGLEGRENKWFWTGAYTYVLTHNASDAAVLRAKLPLLIEKYFPQRYKENGRFELQPVTSIHLESNLSAELEPGGSILYVKLFAIVALVIMIVSGVNLINLSYFKISSRVREVGIRKFLGQSAGKIIFQLSIESALFGLLAMTTAVLLCQALLSRFNLMVQKDLKLWSTNNLGLLGITLILILAICLGATLRPGLRYGTKSASYLLLRTFRNAGNARLRNMLIGLQVGFSFVLLVFSLVVGDQISFFMNKDLGYDKENIVVVRLDGGINKNMEAFKTELIRDAAIRSVSASAIPLSYDGWRFVPEGQSAEKPLTLPLAFCDYGFIRTLGIKLIAGENFSPLHDSDTTPFLINKAAAIELGWQDDPIGRRLELFAPGTNDIAKRGKVIGLIDDYHFESLHTPIKPLVITINQFSGTMLIKIAGKDREREIATIQAVYKKFSDKPFDYQMLDKTIDSLYNNETKLGNVIGFFTVIALFLTCYGLFAMSSLLFNKMLKEVSIRKIFGATQLVIIKQLYTRYAVFNVIAITVGLPVAIYVCYLWLQTFPFRIDLGSSVFMEAGALILAAGLLSMSYYLTLVAFSNPVKFLRNE